MIRLLARPGDVSPPCGEFRELEAGVRRGRTAGAAIRGQRLLGLIVLALRRVQPSLEEQRQAFGVRRDVLAQIRFHRILGSSVVALLVVQPRQRPKGLLALTVIPAAYDPCVDLGCLFHRAFGIEPLRLRQVFRLH